jgi:hypothetical protein
MGVDPAAAQFMELRMLQIEEIARVLRVPLFMIQHMTKSTAWGSGIESMMLAFINITMMPWFTIWQQTIGRDLLTQKSFATHTALFVTRALQRGDFKSMQEGLEIKFRNGAVTRNEWRELEDQREDDEFADEPMVPINNVCRRAWRATPSRNSSRRSPRRLQIRPPLRPPAKGSKPCREKSAPPSPTASVGSFRTRRPASQLRAKGDDQPTTIEGYGALYNSETVIGMWFREVILPGAFADSVKNDDIRVFFNHDPNYILGRTSAGTATVDRGRQGPALRGDAAGVTRRRRRVDRAEGRHRQQLPVLDRG